MENIRPPHTETLITTHSFFTPLIISIMGVCATAIAILSYHIFFVRCCMRRQAARMASLQQLAGSGPSRGVDKKTLLTIPIIAYSSDLDQCECAVCLGDVEEGDLVRLLPKCKHTFHVKCIDEWFATHTSCPVCRSAVAGPVCSPPLPASAASDPDENNDGRINVVVEVPPREIECAGPDADANSSTSGIQMGSCPMLRHCVSLALPRDWKAQVSGTELKRSLSLGRRTLYDTIDMQRDSGLIDGSPCSSLTRSRTFREQSIRQFQRVSWKVRRSFSRICVAQGSEILPY